MKEMLQSKVLMSFIVFVLGFSYLNAFQIAGEKEEVAIDENVLSHTEITMNR